MEFRLIDSCLTPEMIGYKSPGAAGMDLYACIQGKLCIYPGETYRVPTGLSVWIRDPNLVGLISLRSGFNGGFVMPNAPGILDSDYQGELLVKLINVSQQPLCIEPYQRIAQLTLVPVHVVSVFEFVDQFSEVTIRGDKGFGSTGSK